MSSPRNSRALIPASPISESGSQQFSEPSDISGPGAVVDLSVVSGEAISTVLDGHQTENSVVPVVNRNRAVELDAFPNPPQRSLPYHIDQMRTHAGFNVLARIGQEVEELETGSRRRRSDRVFSTLMRKDRVELPLRDSDDREVDNISILCPTGSLSATTEVELPPGFQNGGKQAAPVARPAPVWIRPDTTEERIPEVLFTSNERLPLVRKPDRDRVQKEEIKKKASRTPRSFKALFFGVLSTLGAVLIIVIVVVIVVSNQRRTGALDLQTSDVSIRGINITSPFMDDFMLTLMLDVNKETNLTGGMGSMKCELYGLTDVSNNDRIVPSNLSSELDESFIGRVETDNLVMNKGDFIFVEASSNTINPNTDKWGDLVEAIFAGNENFHLQIKAAGRYLTKSTIWNLGFKKLVPVVGSVEKAQGLFPRRYGMGHFYVKPQNGTFSYTARTVFANPSNLTTFMGDATLDLLMDGEVIGQHVIPDLTVTPNDNEVPFLFGTLNTKVFENSDIFSRFLQATLCWNCFNPGVLSVLGVASYINDIEVPYLTQGMKAVNRSAALISRSDVADSRFSQISNLAIAGAVFNRTSLDQPLAIERGKLKFTVKLPVKINEFPMQISNTSIALAFQHPGEVTYAWLNVSSTGTDNWSAIARENYTLFNYEVDIANYSVVISDRQHFLDESIAMYIGRTALSYSYVGGVLFFDVLTPFQNGSMIMKITPREMEVEGMFMNWAIEIPTQSFAFIPPLAPKTTIIDLTEAPPRPTATKSSTSSRSVAVITTTGYIIPTATPGVGSILKVIHDGPPDGADEI